jgi:hypothetical protein
VLQSRELIGASVELGAVDPHVPDPVFAGPLPGGGGEVVAGRTRAVLSIPSVGTFGVTGGREVRLAPLPGVAPGSVSVWLHGTVAALVLAQQGRFALHASAVAVGGQAVALAGLRGAGKSTTALRLTQRGHALVADDVTPVDPGAPPAVHPFARSVRVAQATATSLGLEVAGAQPVLPGHPKLALPAPPERPIALGAIVVLEAGAGGRVDCRRVRGVQAQQAVWQSAYRVHLLCRVYEPELFAWAAALPALVPVHTLRRPDHGWTVDAVADAVEHLAHSGG